MRLLTYILLFLSIPLFAQENEMKQYSVEANYFYGSILPHHTNILHLIKGHPEGTILSFNRKTFGSQKWESWYNYPDYGVSFQYQDNKNPELGNLYGLYGHMNFYFFTRRMQLRVGQGLAYCTNPYDRETNYRNLAYGARYMPSTYFTLNYHKPNIWKGLGVQAGVNFVHHSNANLQAPNTSTNTIAFNIGLNYDIETKDSIRYIVHPKEKFTEPVRYNVVFRSGVNESDVVDSGQYPFYVASLYADKRINHKSAIQAGTDFFWMLYLKEFIKYQSIAYFENNYDGDMDYRRIGLFVGHELFINKLAVDTQFGYYIYDPSDKFGPLYQRLGLKYYIAKNISAGVSLKTHVSRAEALEFSLGVRL
ncbi:MAG TPA: acyloxyacyl hydrolase [Flavobacterium sp.]|uniref:acyloxyacyl hydrolase n=1 Tax=Flavobacterium sp. TaxID=239 RepID=UPI002BE5E685|nr:acyloxyacyl hydrolase [Flavobacterium sp.]HSD13323.1 acyloxyacyl hydrolase [Flavobacterium sp.]